MVSIMAIKQMVTCDDNHHNANHWNGDGGAHAGCDAGDDPEPCDADKDDCSCAGVGGVTILQRL